MANEDVIEVVSSDEESEPVPKKKKPNAMVHIPKKIKKLNNVTIKPAPKSLNLVILPCKPSNVVNQKGLTSIIKNKPNINSNKPTYKPIPKPSVSTKFIKPLITVQNSSQGTSSSKYVHKTHSSQVNPLTLIKKLSNSQVVISKVKSPPNKLKFPMSIKKSNPTSNLTDVKVTKTVSLAKKRPSPDVKVTETVSLAKKRSNPSNNAKIGDVLTVELDDDVATSTPGPQWYLRPEEQNQPSLEEQNNKEPESKKFIEITIEDSPVKPIQNKRTCEVNTELTITIDDSPVKTNTEKITNKSDSDNEATVINKVPHSKKKLNYPKGNVGDTIEIEIEPIEVSNSHNICDENNVIIEDVEVIESSVNESSVNDTNKLSSDMPKTDPASVEEGINMTEIDNSEINDFHPVYRSFIDLCFKLENSEDMKKIVEKKIKTYYRQVPKEYTESEEFIDMVSCKILAMKSAPEKMYLYIKDVVDELNLQRKMAKTQEIEKINQKAAESDKFLYGEDSEYDLKRQRQIRKLEKTLKKLNRAIKKLEDQEVDFEDDDDSVYLLTERYKERIVRVHAKFCQLTNTKMPSEPYIHIEVKPGQPSGPIKRLEKWINKKVPIGTPLPFPDFHDVLRCVREANKEDKLGWNEADIIEQARDLFTRCGKKLQRRRQENEWRLAFSRISVETDPAETSECLKKKLDENRQVAARKEIDVLNKFADRQNLLKLEAVEIGDKEADESPVESEDEEPTEDSSSLENTEKRKERLKRLIQEKSQITIPEEKENLPFNQSEEIQRDKDKNLGTDEIDVDKEKKGVSNEAKDDVDFANSLSDESKGLESDVDELNLLQKLAPRNGISSSESSDSASPIAISDTLESNSDSENKRQPIEDVISIENSSFSESEVDIEIKQPKSADNKKTEEPVIKPMVEIEFSTVKSSDSGIPLDDVIDENAILASSDEDNAKAVSSQENRDSLSIDDIVIEEKSQDVVVEKNINENKDSLSIGDIVIEEKRQDVVVEKNINENKDSLSIGDIVIEEKSQDVVVEKNINDSSSLESIVVNSQEEHLTIQDSTDKLPTTNIESPDSHEKCDDDNLLSKNSFSTKVNVITDKDEINVSASVSMNMSVDDNDQKCASASMNMSVDDNDQNLSPKLTGLHADKDESVTVENQEYKSNESVTEKINELKDLPDPNLTIMNTADTDKVNSSIIE